MSDFKAKMHQIRFRLRLRPRPRYGELTALPQTPSWISGGLLLRDEMGEKRAGGEREGGRRREGREEGRGVEGRPFW